MNYTRKQGRRVDVNIELLASGTLAIIFAAWVITAVYRWMFAPTGANLFDLGVGIFFAGPLGITCAVWYFRKRTAVRKAGRMARALKIHHLHLLDLAGR